MPKLRPVKEQAPPASLLFESEPAEKEKVVTVADDGTTGEPESEVKIVKDDSAADDLKKQIEALKRSEAEQRRRAEQAEQEREEARRRAQEREAEIKKAQGDVTQSRVEMLAKAIEKETEAAESAERDLQQALTDGDAVKASKAQRRMSQAEAQIVALQNGKAALESEIEAAKTEPKKDDSRSTQQMTVEQVIDSWNVPERAKRWLKAHQDYVTDKRKNARIQYLHHEVVDEGHPEYSEEYFESLETHLGLRKAAAENEEDDDEKTGIVSAPVSREVPASNGRRQSGSVTLTPAQREAAKASGITEAEYAKQLIKLRQEKEAGNYGEQR